MSRWLRWAAVCLAASSLVACTPSSPPQGYESPNVTASPGSPPEGSLAVGFLSEPATLDPFAPRATELTYALVRPVLPSLFLTQPDGSAEPMLAETAQERSNGIDVTLREATWSDGSPITAGDVVKSWRRADAPSGFARFRRAVAVDERTVSFRGAEGSRSEFRAWLATAAFVLPGGEFDRKLSGGSLRISKFEPGLRLDYEPNPSYFGTPVQFEQVTAFFVEESTTMIDLLGSGRLDAASLPSSVNLAARLEDAGLQHSSAYGWEQLALIPLGDSSVPVGIAAALDLSSLQETFIRDDGRAAKGRSGGAPASGSLATPRGDELLYLLGRAAHFQARRASATIELAEVEARLLYARPDSLASLDAALARRMVPPGSEAQQGAAPLFEVKTYLAWRNGLAGPAVNPTFEGPLWNLSEWARTAAG